MQQYTCGRGKASEVQVPFILILPSPRLSQHSVLSSHTNLKLLISSQCPRWLSTGLWLSLLCHEWLRHLSRSHGCDVWQYALQCDNASNPPHNVFCCGSTWDWRRQPFPPLWSLQTINYSKRRLKLCCIWLFSDTLTATVWFILSAGKQKTANCFKGNVSVHCTSCRDRKSKSNVQPDLDLSNQDKNVHDILW